MGMPEDKLKCLICHHYYGSHVEGTYGHWCTKCLGPFQPYHVGSGHMTFHKFAGDNLAYLEYEATKKSSYR